MGGRGLIYLPYEGNSTQEIVYIILSGALDLRKSTDSGATFSDINLSMLSNDMRVSDSNSNLMFTWLGSVVHKSTDAGVNFAAVTSPGFGVDAKDGLAFLRDVVLFATGASSVSTSSDAGSIWTSRIGNLITDIFVGGTVSLTGIVPDWTS